MSKHTSLQQSILEKTKNKKLDFTQVLIIFNLQNEFVSPDGRLPCNELAFVARIKELVPKFREKVGEIIWVRSEFKTDRRVNDGSEDCDQVVLAEINVDEDAILATEESPKLSPVSTAGPPRGKEALRKRKSRHFSFLKNIAQSKKEERVPQRASVSSETSSISKPPPSPPGSEELFLSSSYGYEPKGVPGTAGADFVTEIKDSIEAVDIKIVTSHYSAAKGTDLLDILRRKLVKEVYICGCSSNLSIYATVSEMSQCAFEIRFIEDCLGFRNLQDHENSLRLLKEYNESIESIQSSRMHEDIDASDGGAGMTDIAESMGAMTIVPNGGKAKNVAVVVSESSKSSLAMKKNKVRARSRVNPKPPADAQEQILAAMSRSSTKVNNGDQQPKELSPEERKEILASISRSSTTVGNGDQQRKVLSPEERKGILASMKRTAAITHQLSIEKPMLSIDASAQVLAALGQLSVEDSAESHSQSKARSKSRSKKPKPTMKEDAVEASREGSKDFQEAPASIQPISDSLDSQARLDTTTLNTRKFKEQSEKVIQEVPTSTQSVPTKFSSYQSASDLRLTQATIDTINQSDHATALSEENPGIKRQMQQEMSLSAEGSKEAGTMESESVNPSHPSSGLMADDPNMSKSGASEPPTVSEKKTGQVSATKLKNLANLPTLGPGDKIGEGDSMIRYELLPPSIRDELDEELPLSDTIFTALYHEVQWLKMYHAAGEVPRLVAVQGTINANGDKPIYRHPSDQSPPLLPFTRNVNIIRKEAEKTIGHELNHVLIQLYRDGKDFISEHSDKTLDIMPGTKIVNASFGAQRTMRLRTKKGSFETEGESIRQTQRVLMPHNSLFALGLNTNKAWLHGINPDKRLLAEKSPAELAYNGKRISLTFRFIGTFLDKEEKLIWGQGAVGRCRDEARSVVNGDEVENEKMIRAFSKENREGAGFVWREAYGCGFDVLHFRSEKELDT